MALMRIGPDGLTRVVDLEENTTEALGAKQIFENLQRELPEILKEFNEIVIADEDPRSLARGLKLVKERILTPVNQVGDRFLPESYLKLFKTLGEIVGMRNIVSKKAFSKTKECIAVLRDTIDGMDENGDELINQVEFQTALLNLFIDISLVQFSSVIKNKRLKEDILLIAKEVKGTLMAALEEDIMIGEFGIEAEQAIEILDSLLEAMEAGIDVFDAIIKIKVKWGVGITLLIGILTGIGFALPAGTLDSLIEHLNFLKGME